MENHVLMVINVLLVIVMEVNVLVKMKEFNVNLVQDNVKKDYFVEKKPNDDDYYQCLEPIKAGQSCGGLIEDHDYRYPGDNVCSLGYACTNPTDSDYGKCVKIGSIKESDNDNNNIENPLVCETGLSSSSSKCSSISANENDWDDTSRGLDFKNYANATRHFNDW